MNESKVKQQAIALNWLISISKPKMTLDEIELMEQLRADLLHQVDIELAEDSHD